MEKPGIERAIPGALIGLIIGIALVPFIRWASSIEPTWDLGLVMVVTPFTMMAGWFWGIGAFNPKNSAHAHPPYMHHDEADHDETAIVAAEAHHEEEEQPTPGAILMRETWKAFTYPLLLFVLFFGFALTPGGFFLQLASQDDANVAKFGDGSVFTLPFDVPGIGGELALSQMTMFILLVLAIVIPLALIAGAIGILMFIGHEEVAIAAETEPTIEDLTPPAPLRWAGRMARGLAQSLRSGLPKFFGMK
ncbi:MAG: hypothetical protein Q9P01_07175 [Anaerolineae bacterium]|nr:hypothetical protein [Anaerolineae bacterium]MDQ7034607.1 hypothetical protein [Anaerolineae bacterium]